MKILVCVKRVCAPGSKINVTEDGLAVDTANLGFTTSPHEECALEEAVQIAEREEGEVTVLTMGPAESVEQLRYAASVGAHKAVLIPTDGTAVDPQRTAAAITSAINELEAEDGQFDLIMFGNESADSGGFQVGIRAAYALGRPIINGVKKVELEGDTVVAMRAVDVGVEVYHLPRPAVLGIKEGINLPRYPTMRGRLASKKAEIMEMSSDGPVGGQGLVKLHRAPEVASTTVILGEGPEAAPAVVDILEEIGLI